MSQGFTQRLLPALPEIVKYFGTPFHIYDEQGILEGGERLRAAFPPGFKNYFAVKALPNPSILELMRHLGMGFDCSSIPELMLARGVGATPEEIMFTSNNTSREEFLAAAGFGGCILNLDDLALVAKVPRPFPELICFRYNPGPRRQGNSIIGNPETCKYGVPHDQIVEAYRQAIARGARKFGLHTMVVSNERDCRCFVETANMLLKVVKMISDELDISFDFINLGGGLGIPYRSAKDQPLELDQMAEGIASALQSFQAARSYQPRLLMENGRWVTGPHGVLVTTAINVKNGYRQFVGVDVACTASMMRPAMYHPNGGYHEIDVFTPSGELKQWNRLIDQALFNPSATHTSVVGPACEDNDRFGWDRLLPPVEEGDLVIVHDTGAHCYAMANNYNGRLRPQELMLRADGTVELIRRAPTPADLSATLAFEPNVLSVCEPQQRLAAV